MRKRVGGGIRIGRWPFGWSPALCSLTRSPQSVPMSTAVHTGNRVEPIWRASNLASSSASSARQHIARLPEGVCPRRTERDHHRSAGALCSTRVVASPSPRTSGEELLRGRWTGPLLVSYAQNGEDVRLWRVFAALSRGFYVDVGAGDPVTNSVTKLFYDAGWDGINIEPGPNFDLLERSRPRDVNVNVAIGSEAGEAEMWITSPEPDLSSLQPPNEALLPPGFTVRRTTVRKERLGDILERHAGNREIDFLKVDVEGAELQVLESLDLLKHRPKILLVEAVAPLEFHETSAVWQSSLIDNGYRFAGFDGINRFYVRDDQQHLISALEYPLSVLDRYVLHDAQWRRDSSVHRAPIAGELDDEADLQRQLEALHATVSWRVTRPLRALRRAQLGGRRIGRRSRSHDDSKHLAESAALERARAERLRVATSIVANAELIRTPCDALSTDDVVAELEAAIAAAMYPPEALAWLALTAAAGRYPDGEAVDSLTRRLRSAGKGKLHKPLAALLEEELVSRSATTAGLDVVRDEVLVVSESMVLTDLHTGIQRVAREAVSRWLAQDSTHVAYFDPDGGGLRLLSDSEQARVRNWRDHLSSSGTPMTFRRPQAASDNILVPWNCTVVVPELLLNVHHSRAVATIARAGVSQRLTFIGYDLTPIVVPETVDPGLTERYCQYLAAVKHADRISAISEQSARDFEAFATMLQGEGIPGPRIKAHRLPAPPPDLTEGELASGLAALDLQGVPLVLVVGAHVPRKNHMAILEASERLWIAGRAFELLFIGGFGSSHYLVFERYVQRLRAEGWPVRVRHRASELELWAAYATARFSVYPSFIEGFGLPIAESLASGTPVITSNFGSMAEIAAGGGALTIDPRSVDDLEQAMHRLLTDDALVDELRRQARAQDFGSWDDYAKAVWDYLTETHPAR